MTVITYQTTHLQPTEMWVDGRHARDYVAMGYTLVDYQPPPEMFRYCWSGRVKVRESGDGCDHTWSPQLAALHAKFSATWSQVALECDWRIGCASWKAWNAAFHAIMDTYHVDLMRPRESDSLEDVRDRVAEGIRTVASRQEIGTVRKAIERVADLIGVWEMPS